MRKYLKWFYFTRGLGTITVLYELFFATGTAERGTIILAGFGIFGYDLAVRREQ